MKTIFLIEESIPYEASSIVCAFDNEPAAESFMESIRTHSAKRPKYKTEPSTEEEWEAWDKKEKAWETKHPAGKYHCYRDFEDFDIREIDIFADHKAAIRSLKKETP